MERQGKALRVLEADLQAETLDECFRIFAEEFKRGNIFPAVKRIVVKEYPDMAADVLKHAGFMKEMQDWVLYK